MVEVRDCDGTQTDAGTALGDSACDCRLLGATGEAIGAVLHVAAGDDRAVGEQKRRAYAEVTVGRVGVLRGSECKLAKLLLFARGERIGSSGRRQVSCSG